MPETTIEEQVSKLETIIKGLNEELLRVRTTCHGAAHQLDNLAIEFGWGAGLSAFVIADRIRTMHKDYIELLKQSEPKDGCGLLDLDRNLNKTEETLGGYYSYEALDASGREIKSQIRAVFVEDAIAQIRELGYFPLKIKKAGDAEAYPKSLDKRSRWEHLWNWIKG